MRFRRYFFTIGCWVITGALLALILSPLLAYYGGFFSELVARENRAQWFLQASPRSMRLLLAGLSLAALVSLFSLLLGLPLAFAYARTDLFAKRALLVLSLLPMVIPPYLWAVSWGIVLGRLAFNFWGCVLVLALSYWPCVFILAAIAFKGIPQEFEELAAFSERPFGVFRKVTFPLATKGILSGVLLVFFFAFSEFSVPLSFGVPVYATEVFLDYESSSKVPLHSGSLIPPLAALGFVLILGRLYRSSRPLYTIAAHPDEGRTPYPLGRLRLFLSALPLFLLTGHLGLLSFSLFKRAASARAFKSAWRLSYGDFSRSLSLAVLGSLALLVIALVLYFTFRKLPSFVRKVLQSLLAVNFVVPGAMIGVGLLLICSKGDEWLQFVYGSPLIVLVGYVARFSVIAYIGVLGSLLAVPGGLEEMACVSGVSSWRTFLSGLVPAASARLVLVLSLLFLFCFAEVGVSVLVQPPGYGAVQVRLFTLMHYGYDGVVASLSLMMLGAISCFMVILLMLGNRLALHRV